MSNKKVTDVVVLDEKEKKVKKNKKNKKVEKAVVEEVVSEEVSWSDTAGYDGKKYIVLFPTSLSATFLQEELLY